MCADHDFGVPDRAGFDALIQADFIRIGGSLIRKSVWDRRSLISEVDKSAEIQRELNHTHLILFAESITVQRAWADELEERWQRRLSAEHSDLVVHTSRQDTGSEVIVTLWAAPKRQSLNRGGFA